MEPLNEQFQDLYPPDQPHQIGQFNYLLEENHQSHPYNFDQPALQPKEDHRLPPLDHQHQHQCDFNLKTIQKQDQIRPIPQKLEEERPEEDSLDFDLLPKKPSYDSIITQKRSSFISKTIYQQQTRRDKIVRYLQKKERRVWSRKISYNCRKLVADQRQRKNGRFVKKEEKKSSNPAPSSARKSTRQTGEGEGKESFQYSFQDCYQ